MASVQGMKMESIQGGAAPREKAIRSDKSTDSKPFLSLLGKAGKSANAKKSPLEGLLVSGESSSQKSALSLLKSSGADKKQKQLVENGKLQENLCRLQEKINPAEEFHSTDRMEIAGTDPITVQIQGSMQEQQDTAPALMTEGTVKVKSPSSLAASSKGKAPSKVEMLITVEDLRQKKAPLLASVGKDSIDPKELALKAEVGQNHQPTQRVEAQADQGQSVEKEFISEIRNPDNLTFSPQGGGGKMEAPVTKEMAQAFQEHLSRSGNAEIVRKIQFVLKDNNAGEIKLVLRPESLGNVRIQLSMNENNIVGRIVVDNQSVKDAFQNNLNQLNQILKDNGFDNAELDVFVGQHNQGEGQSPEDLREEFEAFKNARSLRVLDQAVNEVPQWDQGSRQGVLNMVM